MKIVLSLIQQIDGTLRITSGADGRGAKLYRYFGLPSVWHYRRRWLKGERSPPTTSP